jgi:hypothetical protein
MLTLIASPVQISAACKCLARTRRCRYANCCRFICHFSHNHHAQTTVHLRLANLLLKIKLLLMLTQVSSRWMAPRLVTAQCKLLQKQKPEWIAMPYGVHFVNAGKCIFHMAFFKGQPPRILGFMLHRSSGIKPALHEGPLMVINFVNVVVSRC